MNPIPRNDTAQTGASFRPKCNETCTGCSGGAGGACATCRCTGEWGPANLEIVDRVALPWMLPAGDYVLGWRWDVTSAAFEPGPLSPTCRPEPAAEDGERIGHRCTVACRRHCLHCLSCLPACLLTCCLAC